MADRSLSPRRQHPAWIFLSAIRQLRGLALPLIVLLLSGGGRGDSWFLTFGAALALLGVVSRAAAWWQYRYEVTGGELRVYSGILSRRERLIPLERVQAVDFNETPLQRLFGVVGVRIETAAGGSAGSDVLLSALSRSEAALLREWLAVSAPGLPSRVPNSESLQESAVASAAPQLAPVGELVRRLTTRELLLTGVTSGRIGPALAIVSFAFQFADDLLPDRLWERIAVAFPGWSLSALLTLGAVIAVGAWLLAILSTALTFASFELRRDGDRLLIAYGLLDRRRRSIPLNRIQAVTVAEGLLRRPFRLATIRFESAGYGKATPESGILFPILRRDDVSAFLTAAAPPFAATIESATLSPPPPRSRRRYLLGGVWPLLALTILAVAIAALAPWQPWWRSLAPLLLLPFTMLNGWLRFRATGWTIDASDRLIARSGGVERRTTIAPRRRLQHRSVTQNLAQRRASLASFRAAVASGGSGGLIRLQHLDEPVAFELLNHLAPPSRPAKAPEPGEIPATVS